MAKGMIMGSGGGGNDPFAVIGVICRSSDTVTCQNEYGEALTPQTGSTQHVFQIPEAGTWTVAAGDRSKEIEIENEGQCEKVQLAKIDLLHGTSFDVNWSPVAASTYVSTTGTMAAPSVQQTANGAKLILTKSSGYGYGSFMTANKVNMTPYTSLHFDLKETNICFSGSTGLDIKVNIASAVNGYYNTDVVYQRTITVAAAGNYLNQVIDLASINGEYYVAVEIKVRYLASDNNTSSFYIDNVYLE